jgi:hypothetical protein
MKANKKLAAACIAVVALVAVFVGVYVSTRPETQQGDKTIVVEVVHSDESSKEFTYSTDFEYLGEVLEAEELVVFEDGAYGMFITTVDGEQAIYEEDGAYWALYEGEEYAAQGADQTVIEDGDQFALVYTVA